MRRKHLEILLSKLKTNPKPKLRFEEYYLDSRSASTLLHVAMSQGDILGKDIVDLGCGTGILAIGAAILGARQVVGVDIDEDSILMAVNNMNDVGAQVTFVSGTMHCIQGSFDTTIMNPPFGSWARGSDLSFLEKALSISKVIYSLHKASNKSDMFLSRKIGTMGGDTRKIGEVELTIPHLYDFHKKPKYRVNASLYRTVTRAY